jgi:tRNA_anti-like
MRSPIITRLGQIAVFVTVAALFGCKGGDTPKDGDKAQKENAGVDTGPIAVASEALAEEFAADPVAAEAKYKGKTLEITGGYASELASVRVVYLKGAKKKDGSPCHVRCWVVPEIEKKAATLHLSQGQKLKLVGRYNEFTQGEVDVRECSLTELEPSKLTPVSSELFAKEFDDDPAATLKKYENQEVVLSGPILDFKKGGLGGDLRLVGTKKTKIYCAIDARDQAYLEKNFGRGDVLVIRGHGIRDTFGSIAVPGAVIVPKKGESK